MTRIALRLILLSAILLPAGCASIPLSTMWHMAGYSVEDIGRLNPAEIRVALLLPEGVSLKPGSEALRLKLFHEEGDPAPAMQLDATLEQYAEGRVAPLSIPTADAEHHWELFRVRPEDYQRFSKFQSQFMAQRDELHYKQFTVNIDMKPLDQPLHELTLSVWLKLEREDEPFKLIDNATLTVKNHGA